MSPYYIYLPSSPEDNSLSHFVLGEGSCPKIEHHKPLQAPSDMKAVIIGVGV